MYPYSIWWGTPWWFWMIIGFLSGVLFGYYALDYIWDATDWLVGRFKRLTGKFK